jgi:hypothetical protein
VVEATPQTIVRTVNCWFVHVKLFFLWDETGITSFKKGYLYLTKSKICLNITCVRREQGACNYGSCDLFSGGSNVDVRVLVTVCYSLLCRKCEVMEETSAHILCECETLASIRHVHLGPSFLEPKDIQSISPRAIWSFSNASGLPWLHMGHKGPVYKGLGASGPLGPELLKYSYLLILNRVLQLRFLCFTCGTR